MIADLFVTTRRLTTSAFLLILCGVSQGRAGSPDFVIAAKKANAGNGSAYPDGFTISLTTDGEETGTVSLPLVHLAL
jgi:hypothetical protein